MISIQNVVKSIIDIFTSNSSSWGNKIGDFVNLLSITIMNELPKLLTTFGNIFVQMFQVVKDGLPVILPVFIENFIKLLDILSTIIPDIVDVVSQIITEIVNAIAKDGGTILKSFFDIILNVIKVIMKKYSKCYIRIY